MTPEIQVPNMCRLHQSLLVLQTEYAPTDPWRALIIATQIALFQAATADDGFYARVGGDLGRIGEVGCLACFKPDAFGAIVDVAQRTRDLGAIKRLGESWVKDARADRATGPAEGGNCAPAE